MKTRNITSFMLVLILTTVLPNVSIGGAVAAETYTTGWVTGYEIRRTDLYGKAKRNHFLPTKISCKNGASDKGNYKDNMLLKIDYVDRDIKDPKRRDWKWRWATSIRKFEIENARKGFKLVSKDSFKRATGLVIKCAIWHRPRK